MEPTQTINLIALSLIVVMHAGVLALRLGIRSKESKSKTIWSNPGKLFVEKIKAWFSIPKINFVDLFIIIFNNFFLSIC